MLFDGAKMLRSTDSETKWSSSKRFKVIHSMSFHIGRVLETNHLEVSQLCRHCHPGRCKVPPRGSDTSIWRPSTPPAAHAAAQRFPWTWQHSIASLFNANDGSILVNCKPPSVCAGNLSSKNGRIIQLARHMGIG